MRPPYFDDETILIDFQALRRRTGLYSKDVIRLQSRGASACLQQLLPERSGRIAGHHEVVTRQPERFMPPHLKDATGANVLQRREFQEFGAAEDASQNCAGPGTGEMNLRILRGPVRQLKPLADEIMVEVLVHLVPEPRRCIEPESRVPIGIANVIDEDPRDHAGLGGGQERFAAGAAGELANIVCAEIMEEARGIGTGHLNLAPVRHVKGGSIHSGLSILVGALAVAGRHQPTAVFRKDGPFLSSRVMERSLFRHS